MMESTAHAVTWNALEKLGFRFAFLFIILFIVLLDWSVNVVFALLYYELGMAQLLDSVVGAVGRHVFGIAGTIVSPYDGQHNDRVYIYLLYGIMTVVALVGTAIWSVLDRHRPHYRTLYYWLTTIVRYYLAFTLFLFALEKFFKLQFPDLEWFVLHQPVGDMTPMQLAWAFFGYSGSYNLFMGFAESAPLLLLSRRTMTLGALLTVATLANVVAVNFSYDVHAKMYPLAMLLMALFLLLPQLSRLKRFFVDGEAVSLKPIEAPVLKTRRVRLAKTVVKFLLIGSVLVVSVRDYVGYRARGSERELAKREAGVSGVFDVRTFVVNTDTLADDNPATWRTLYLGGARERVQLAGDSLLTVRVGVEQQTLQVYANDRELTRRAQEIFDEFGANAQTAMMLDSVLVAREAMSIMQFESRGASTLLLRGVIRGDSVVVTAQRRPREATDFRLIRHGFHWVTE